MVVLDVAIVDIVLRREASDQTALHHFQVLHYDASAHFEVPKSLYNRVQKISNLLGQPGRFVRCAIFELIPFDPMANVLHEHFEELLAPLSRTSWGHKVVRCDLLFLVVLIDPKSYPGFIKANVLVI
jgi:hypothetical protein